jgi:hypothetical protein
MHVIQAEHEAFFRELFRIPPGDDLPEDITNIYWKFKRICDSRNIHVTPTDLAWMAVMCDQHVPVDKKNFLDVVREKKDGLNRGDAVEILWRGKWMPGYFVSAKQKTVVVSIDDGTGEEREVYPDKVRLPQTVEV